MNCKTNTPCNKAADVYSMYQNWTVPESRNSDMAAFDMFDYSDMMAQGKVRQMVLDVYNTVDSSVHCYLMYYWTLPLLYTQPDTHETNISHSLLPRTWHINTVKPT
jgi:thymidylate kinase